MPLTATTQTQATFTGELGVAYTFRVRATDNVSNTSAWVEATAKTVVVKKYYSIAGQRVAMRENGVVYWLHGDHLGSTSLTTDETGAVVAEQKYLPYGEVRWVSGSLPTDRQFTDQRSEAALGDIYDYRARFYSSRLGRFVSADTIVPGVGSQHLSRYMYVTGNAVRYNDPTGHARPTEDARAYAWKRGEWALAEMRYKAIIALYRVIHGEQSGMGYDVKEAAGAVVLNRASSSGWSSFAGAKPGSYESVYKNAYKSGQFEGYKNVTLENASTSYRNYKEGKATKQEKESWKAVYNLMKDYERLGTKFYGSHEIVGNACYFGNLHDGPVIQNPDGTYSSITKEECPQCQTALQVYNERGATLYPDQWGAGVGEDQILRPRTEKPRKLFFFHNINPVGCKDLNF